MSQSRKRSDGTKTSRTAGARSPAERLEPGRAPSRPRGVQAREPSRMFAGVVRAFSGVFTVALVGMLLIGGTSFIIFHQFENPGPLDAQRTVIIPKGEGRIAIGDIQMHCAKGDKVAIDAGNNRVLLVCCHGVLAS